MAENAGGVFITIDGDSSPLLAKYAQAEAQSRAAGQKIAGALGQGFQQSTGLVDQFGKTIQSVQAPTDALQAEIKALSSAIVALTASLDSGATPALRRTQSAMDGVTQSSAHAVTEIQAVSGTLRTLDGNGGIRAAERFIASTLGIGGALQAIFPLVGLLALGDIIFKTVGRFGELSEAEKEAQRQTQQLDHAWSQLASKFESGEIQRATLEIGKLAGLKLTSFYDDAAADRDRAKLAQLQKQLQTARSQQAGDVAANTPSSNLAVAAAQAVNPTVTVIRYLNNVDWKAQEEKAKGLEGEISKLTESLNVYDTVTSKVNQDQIVNQQQNDAAEAARKAAEEQRKAQEEAKRAATEAAREQRAVVQDVSFARKQAAEEEKRIDRENNESMLQGLEQGVAVDQRASEERIRSMQAEEAERNRLNQEQIRGGGVQTQNRDDLALIQAKQNYQAQIVHSKAEELAYTAEIQSLEEQALKDRIANLEALKEYEILNGLVKESDQTDLEIERAKAALKKQQVTDQGALLQQGKSQTLAGQIQAKVGTGPANLVDAKNLVIANGIGTAVDGIASAMGRAVQGGQKLSQIFSQLGKSILGSVVQGIVKIGLQMVTTALLGKSAGSAIAVAEVTSAAAVGAANAAAATAAIPIVGPELAPGVAAATFAEIMAFAPLASYDKGGMIPRDMIAQVHKDEYVLTADQVSGRSPMPSLPGTGVVGSASAQFTNTASSNSYANSLSVGAIHLHGVQNVEDVARRLPNVLKTRSPIFSPATR